MKEKEDYQLTILVPFYNEEDNILNIEKELKAFMNVSVIPSVAILFVNDGSKDKGMELVEEVCKRNEPFIISR